MSAHDVSVVVLLAVAVFLAVIVLLTIIIILTVVIILAVVVILGVLFPLRVSPLVLSASPSRSSLGVFSPPSRLLLVFSTFFADSSFVSYPLIIILLHEAAHFLDDDYTVDHVVVNSHGLVIDVPRSMHLPSLKHVVTLVSCH